MHGPKVHVTIIDSMHHMQKQSQGLAPSQPVTVDASLRAFNDGLGQRQCITEKRGSACSRDCSKLLVVPSQQKGIYCIWV